MLQKILATIVIAASLSLAQAGAWAQAYPSKPVRFIIAAAPGGGTDVVGRLIAQRLAERLGQPFVTENRGGAGGALAADFVAKAPADGYTLLMTNDQLVVSASFPTKQPYDALKDLAPIGLVGRTPVVLAVHPSVPANSVGELVALVRAQPGKFAFTSCGPGTILHLGGELLNLAAQTDLAHAGYRGCAPALLDVVSGQVPIAFNMLGNALPFEKSGKVRLLGVASLKRLPGLPNLPTIAEAGMPGFEVFPWYGVLAPAATPKEIVAKLAAEIAAIVTAPEINEKLRSLNFEPVTATPEAFAEIMRNDLARWTRVVREAKIKLE